MKVMLESPTKIYNDLQKDSEPEHIHDQGELVMDIQGVLNLRMEASPANRMAVKLNHQARLTPKPQSIQVAMHDFDEV